MAFSRPRTRLSSQKTWRVKTVRPAPSLLSKTRFLSFKSDFYGKDSHSSNQIQPCLGILISVVAGVIMAFFYRFVAASMDMENFASPAPGKLTPYTAVFVFAIGVFVSNFLFNTLAMKHPVEGKPVSICGYFKGNMSTHLVGVLGGVIWCIGQSFSMIASEKAGAAISYGLGQGATLVSALWGILIWKEFKGAPAISNRLNVGMFILFVIGLGFLIYAGA